MAIVEDSILDTTKQMVNLEAEDTAFDLDIITHINSVFFVLNQLGVGPSQGFTITDNTKTWSTYTGTDKIELVKSYMFLKVRLLFDMPQNSFTIEAMKSQATEMEWRLNVHMEGVKWQTQQIPS